MHFKLACVIKAGTHGCVFIDNETLEWCQLNALQASPVEHLMTALCFIVNEHITKCRRYSVHYIYRVNTH